MLLSSITVWSLRNVTCGLLPGLRFGQAINSSGKSESFPGSRLPSSLSSCDCKSQVPADFGRQKEFELKSPGDVSGGRVCSKIRPGTWRGDTSSVNFINLFSFVKWSRNTEHWHWIEHSMASLTHAETTLHPFGVCDCFFLFISFSLSRWLGLMCFFLIYNFALLAVNLRSLGWWRARFRQNGHIVACWLGISEDCKISILVIFLALCFNISLYRVFLTLLNKSCYAKLLR